MKNCVSLEVAQKLQKAGYKSECDYKYVMDLPDGNFHLERVIGNPQCPPAPTATQLAEELPQELWFGTKTAYWLNLARMSYGWAIGYVSHKKGAKQELVEQTLPDALGLMMCYLLEKKLIK